MAHFKTRKPRHPTCPVCGNPAQSVYKAAGVKDTWVYTHPKGPEMASNSVTVGSRRCEVKL